MKKFEGFTNGSVLLICLVFMGSSAACFIITWVGNAQIPESHHKTMLEFQVLPAIEGKFFLLCFVCLF